MKPMAVGLSSSYADRCESTEEGQFRACVSNAVFELEDGREISVNDMADALCRLGETSFC